MYYNIRKIATSQGDDYTTGSSLYQRTLWVNCSRFNWTTKTTCWSKSNTIN